jgi:hypothetical protein
MVDFILFILIIGVAIHSFETRRRIINVANYVDEANRVLANEILDNKAKKHKRQ